MPVAIAPATPLAPGLYRAELKLDLGLAAIIVGETPVTIALKSSAMPVLLILVVALLLATPVAAQQGSLQVSASAQAITGETPRVLNTLGQVEPDLGVTWLQPGTRFGTVQLELRGTERKNEFHAGRIYGSLRDLKFGSYTWTIEGGDAYYAPAIGEYQFSNLSTPIVTFVGGAVSARSARTSVGMVAGQGTVWRNIFGSDPDTLDQTIVGGPRRRTAPAIGST